MSIQAAWAEVLEVEESEVSLYIGDVASLLRDVRDAASHAGPAFDPVPRHLNTLSRSILPFDIPLNQESSQVAPDSTAMEALKMLSAFLEETAPQGTLPTSSETGALRDDVAELMEAVIEADLPPEIRRTLLDRLDEMVEALEHLAVGGPEAVRRAAEALAISALLYEDDANDDSGLFTRLRSTARKTWVAFTVTATLAGAVTTFDRLADVGLLVPPREQLQLPPGSSPGDDGAAAAASTDGK